MAEVPLPPMVAGWQACGLMVRHFSAGTSWMPSAATSMPSLRYCAHNALVLQTSGPSSRLLGRVWGRRQVTGIPVEQLFAYINPNALFLGQWDFKKKGLDDAAYEKMLDETARPVFAALQKQALAEGLLDPKVVYGYFPVQSDGDDLIVYHVTEFAGCTCGCATAQRLQPSGPAREWMRFSFPRQNTKRRLCVADFFRGKATGEYDRVFNQWLK